MTRPHLFTPLTLRGLTLKNRIVVSPMCQYKALDGATHDWHVMHHAKFAMGGAGLGFVEATAVAREGRITHGCTGLYLDEHVPGLRRIADLYHSYGAAAGIQIGHAGRRASCARPWEGAAPLANGGPDAAWQTVGPSAVPEKDGYPAPRELSAREIPGIVDAFVAAAKRALLAGFDVAEIHGAHGYLIHSFLSPVSNRREDAYGGSLEKRMRFPLEVAEAMRAAWPDDKPLFYRTSAVDGVENGVTIEDTVALARALKARGVDVVDCSMGGMSGAATLSTRKINQGYIVPYADEVRRETGIATMAVGAIMDPAYAESVLADGKADLIAIGRELLANPSWPYRAALELGLEEPDSVLPMEYGFYLSRRAKALAAD